MCQYKIKSSGVSGDCTFKKNACLHSRTLQNLPFHTQNLQNVRQRVSQAGPFIGFYKPTPCSRKEVLSRATLVHPHPTKHTWKQELNLGQGQAFVNVLLQTNGLKTCILPDLTVFNICASSFSYCSYCTFSSKTGEPKPGPTSHLCFPLGEGGRLWPLPCERGK